MKMLRSIAVLAAVSALAFGTAVYADKDYGEDGYLSQSERNYGSHPAEGPPATAVASGQTDRDDSSPDPSDRYREGLEECDDPSDCE
jgi:hypothetical protein